jgi:hypothetical protein
MDLAGESEGSLLAGVDKAHAVAESIACSTHKIKAFSIRRKLRFEESEIRMA